MYKLCRIFCIFCSIILSTYCFAIFRVGIGSSDITGPVAGTGFMGYAKPDQIGLGLHMRLFSKAFIFENLDSNKRIVFVSADLGHIFKSIQTEVINKLNQKYGVLYTKENVMLSATHTHSGPGGYAKEILYNVTTLGFNSRNFNTIVNGIVNSISLAHENLRNADVYLNMGDVYGVSKNRSQPAYDNNPKAERDLYSFPFDTQMTVLRIQNQIEQMGMLNWFPLHPVSMSNLNKLVSPDHKGLSNYAFENKMRSNGHNSFIAAFAQSNEGDVSPNVNNEPDDPNENDYKRTQFSATKQVEVAQALYDSASQKLNSDIDYRYIELDFSNIKIENDRNNINKTTCPASLGYAFAAGTEDGAGASFFHEGDLKSNPYIDLVTSIISRPDQNLKKCQAPKPILLAPGILKPKPWVTSILPLQIFRIGKLIIVGVPAEFTTMSGRRLKTALKDVFKDNDLHIVIAGLSNGYSGYVTTPEEYVTQNYEGGFTLFGQMTLPAYIQEFSKLAHTMLPKFENKFKIFSQNKTTQIFDNSQTDATLQIGVLFDDVPPGHKFGDQINKLKPKYTQGENITVQFYGGHPSHDHKTNDTYVLIERKIDGNWIPVMDDNHPDTYFKWERLGISYSKNTVTWKTNKDTLPGLYRIYHSGHYLNGWSRKTVFYEGFSDPFEVKINEEL